MKYLVVVVVGMSGIRTGTGWHGQIEADAPEAAGFIAVGRHRDSDCFACGEDILGCEVRTLDGELILDDSNDLHRRRRHVERAAP